VALSACAARAQSLLIPSGRAQEQQRPVPPIFYEWHIWPHHGSLVLVLKAKFLTNLGWTTQACEVLPCAGVLVITGNEKGICYTRYEYEDNPGGDDEAKIVQIARRLPASMLGLMSSARGWTAALEMVRTQSRI
jgi:hypothetical protein